MFGSSSFSIDIINDETSDSRTDTLGMLSGSNTHELVSASEYVVISDFLVGEKTPYVELMALNFTVDVPVNVTFIITNSNDESIISERVS